MATRFLAKRQYDCRMAKNKNQTMKVHPTISKQMGDYIEELIKLGAYGNNDAQVTCYLIQRGLDELIRAKVIDPRSKLR
jgi:hypothetical protein